MVKPKNTKEIENLAIQHVVDYLNKHKKVKNLEVVKKGVDIIAGKDWIEVKGCIKRETNIRVSQQTLDCVTKNRKLKDFYIYFVYEMASRNPKLLIFDYATFKKYKVEEVKHIIQPRKIIRETGKPDIIELPFLKTI